LYLVSEKSAVMVENSLKGDPLPFHI
jgi:hypothetical protein